MVRSRPIIAVAITTAREGILGDDFPACLGTYVGHQALAVVVGAQTRHDDGADEQHNGQHGEGSQFFARGEIRCLPARGVHAAQLEAEIGQAGKVQQDNADGADQTLAAGDPEGGEHDQDGDWDRGDGEVFLGGVGAADNNDELDGEAETEEEVEFEERDVNLVGEVAALQTEVGADMFVDGPGEFVVEFVGRVCHSDGEDADHARQRGHRGLCGRESLDLSILHTTVDEEANVETNQSDDLDCVFPAQRVPDQNKLIQKGKDVEG